MCFYWSSLECLLPEFWLTGQLYVFLLTHSFILYIFVHVYPHSRERHDFFNGVLSPFSSFICTNRFITKKNYDRSHNIPLSIITSWSNEELKIDGGGRNKRTQCHTHTILAREEKRTKNPKLNKGELLKLSSMQDKPSDAIWETKRGKTRQGFAIDQGTHTRRRHTQIQYFPYFGGIFILKKQQTIQQIVSLFLPSMKNSLVYKKRWEENKQTRENICLHIRKVPNKLKHAQISLSSHQEKGTQKNLKIKELKTSNGFPVWFLILIVCKYIYLVRGNHRLHFFSFFFFNWCLKLYLGILVFSLFFTCFSFLFILVAFYSRILFVKRKIRRRVKWM